MVRGAVTDFAEASVTERLGEVVEGLHRAEAEYGEISGLTMAREHMRGLP